MAGAWPQTGGQSHLSGSRNYTVSAFALRLVERLIAPLEQRFHRVFSTFERSNPDRHRDRQGSALCARIEGLGSDQLPHPLSNPKRHGFVGVGENDDELLASGPARQIEIAQAFPQPSSEFLQHPVADVMAVIVVDRLEVIDVDHEQR
jgi:hypothetical protein